MDITDLLQNEDVVEPETLHMLFPNLTQMEKQKVLAIKVIHNNRCAFEDMDVFENIVFVLNGIDPNVTIMEGSTPEFIWKALDTIRQIHPKIEFAEEVKEYIKSIFLDQGYKVFPPKSGIDSPLLEQVEDRALHGPFPLEEDDIGIQALRYLKTMEYIKTGE